jgi:hypothetical protein
MSRKRTLAVAFAATTTMAGLVAGSGVAAYAASAPAGPAASPVLATLSGVSSRTTTDAWAVGSTTSEVTGIAQALIEHWNGTSWKTVTTPTLAGGSLSSVSADSANDAWASGYYEPATTKEPLLEHWNGATWTKATLPTYANGAVIQSVSATSATNAFATGWEFTSSGPVESIILHWNGRTWTQETVPNPVSPNEGILQSISATSPTNAWAAGWTYTASNGQLLDFLLRWNGKTWTEVPTGSVGDTLQGVSADSATDAWATGYTGTNKTLILHWNGTKWTQVASPTTDYPYASLTVDAQSPTDIWAAGSYATTKGASLPNRTLLLRGNGTSFKQTKTPVTGSLVNEVLGVSADSATDAWAVGWWTGSSSSEVTLILHWNGTSWTKVTSPN